MINPNRIINGILGKKMSMPRMKSMGIKKDRFSKNVRNQDIIESMDLVSDLRKRLKARYPRLDNDIIDDIIEDMGDYDVTPDNYIQVADEILKSYK
jgi:hypothetical protein